MKPRTLSIDTPIPEVESELRYTGAHLRAHPFLQHRANQTDDLLTKCQLVAQREAAIERAIMEVEARKLVVDDLLNILSTAIAGTLLVENGNDRSAPVFQRYYGNITPSRFIRPILGEQLATMRTWIPSLLQSSPALQAYATRLTQVVADADAVVQAEADARREQADFQIGARKEYIDSVNAFRHALYGELAELPHGRPELDLPRDFPNRFFLRSSSPRRPTITTLERDVTRLRTQLQRAEEQLAQMIEEAKTEARQREDEELAEAKEALALAEQQRAAAAALVAEIEARRA